MTFLDTLGTEAKIRTVLTEEGLIRAAVAYWGQGAVEKLGIEKHHDLTVVCDLRSGGCNPNEIAKLQKIIGKDNVLTNDRLHAKVWIGKNTAILGSSNASTNGLCFEGDEAASLIEANAIVQDPTVVTSLDTWWTEKVLPGARAITPDDYTIAKRRHKQNRLKRPVPAQTDLIKALLTTPAVFEDRNFFVWVYESEEASKKAYAAHTKAKKELGDDKISFWVDAVKPPGSYILSFEINEKFSSGLWQILGERHIYKYDDGKHHLLLCRNINTFDGLKLGSKQMWRKAAAQAANFASQADKKKPESGQDEWDVVDFAKNFLK